eukprot:CAMPEP_0181174460 /NCGR_PEP_ID=MMETSP1096-20121128/3548_1 /TAXON_ID=156174 ORGANISM="Chrysochromulina ericina, Strain CCMP281" /NCGR_SAMPLE_ID=MMETSP1096 /ASSEMBLY_ACC=CAM_ASM_000453 /LENGTH=89 /DNA_ID=CAMNT_0023262363 /DNA_START=345 /DNA_END=612 /DNA_ORIENTATION=+
MCSCGGAVVGLRPLTVVAQSDKHRGVLSIMVSAVPTKAGLGLLRLRRAAQARFVPLQQVETQLAGAAALPVGSRLVLLSNAVNQEMDKG